MSQPRTLREDAVAIWNAGVAAVDGRKLVKENVAWSKDELRLGSEMFPIAEIDRLLVVGFGKASAAMAVGFEEALADSIYDTFEVSGLVIVPDDQVLPTKFISVVGCRPPGENLPTERVVDATGKLIEMVDSLGPNDICVCLISGGGSALLEKPIESVSLDELRQTTTALSLAGASIDELNSVRRAISQVKGGQLALRSSGAPVVSLIISDVVGDDLSVIASGPTVVSAAACCPVAVLKKYDADKTSIPDSVWIAVSSFDPQPAKVPYGLEISPFVVGNIGTATQAAAEYAIQLGYEVTVANANGNEGDAAAVGKCIAKQLSVATTIGQPTCEIAGGETTVTVGENHGKGGRNQHLVLAAWQCLQKSNPEPAGEFCLLSGGTDGEDGNVSVAGGVIDSDSISRVKNEVGDSICEQIENALAGFGSHALLAKHDLTFGRSGNFKTNTNVGDLRIVLQANSSNRNDC